MSKWVILRVIMVTKAEHSKLRNKYILYGFATFFCFRFVHFVASPVFLHFLARPVKPSYL